MDMRANAGQGPGASLARVAQVVAATRRLAARRRRRVMAGAMLLVAVLALAALGRMTQEIDRAQLLRALDDAPAWRIAAAIGATGLSFLALTFYDWTGLAALGARRPWRQVAPGAAAAFAVAQTAGLGPLTGAAVRWRFYAGLGLGATSILRLVAFCTLSFALGLALTAGIAALASPVSAAATLGVSVHVAAQVALAALAATAAALALAHRWGGAMVAREDETATAVPGAAAAAAPGLRFRRALLAQMGVTIADVAAAGLALWLLLPAGAIDFAGFLPLYALALALGVMSHAPAGIGVFEVVILAGLSGHVAPAESAAALVLYRLVYHALPLALALVGIAAAEARRLLRAGPVAAVLSLGAEASPRLASPLALGLGLVTIFARPEAVSHADAATLLAGGALVAAAPGLARGLDLTWRVAAAAALAAGLSLALAAPSALALAHLAFAAALGLSRTRHRRPTRLRLPALATRRARTWASSLALVAVGTLAWRLSGGQAQAQAMLAAAGAEAELGAGARAGIAAAFALLGFLPAPRQPVDAAPDAGDLARARRIVDAQPVAAARLALAGDKRLLFSEDGRGFVMYARRGRAWLALQDPVGPEELWPELIWSFIATARAAGGVPAFYQVGPERLSLYAEAGLAFWKMGEQARVNLAEFTLEGSRRQGHRRVLSLGARDGLTAEILSAEAAAREIDRLREVSDAWLAARGAREKGFSLGAFSEDWILSGRVAVARRAGEIVAFVSLMETGRGEEVSIDLMRHLDDVPTKCMEFLFLRMCEDLKAEGAVWLDLAMAPLSGLAPRAGAPAWRTLAHALYEHGTKTYSFKGLRRFKEGLKPEWRPRYLAAGPGAAPASALLAANRLINRPEGRETAAPR